MRFDRDYFCELFFTLSMTFRDWTGKIFERGKSLGMQTTKAVCVRVCLHHGQPVFRKMTEPIDRVIRGVMNHGSSDSDM